jgi:hypothetical protein
LWQRNQEVSSYWSLEVGKAKRFLHIGRWKLEKPRGFFKLVAGSWKKPAGGFFKNKKKQRGLWIYLLERPRGLVAGSWKGQEVWSLEVRRNPLEVSLYWLLEVGRNPLEVSSTDECVYDIHQDSNCY